MSWIMGEAKAEYEWLEIAIEAARSAGLFLKNERDSGAKVTMEFERDVKLIADVRAEEIIINCLQKQSSFQILSEEKGVVGDQYDGSDLQWIVDPLDGSLNYLRGIPICCVSIGLWKGNEPLLGVVYDFNREQVFSGIKGQGAWLNGNPIQVSELGVFDKAVLCTGFPISTDFSSEAILGFVEQVRKYKKLRLLGSAALSLAYVASGLADAYFERNIKIWDVAAGLAIVQAAGGLIHTLLSEKNIFTVYAGNALLPKPNLNISK